MLDTLAKDISKQTFTHGIEGFSRSSVGTRQAHENEYYWESLPEMEARTPLLPESADWLKQRSPAVCLRKKVATQVAK